MVIADPDTHIMTLVNPALALMHGYTVDELTGMHLRWRWMRFPSLKVPNMPGYTGEATADRGALNSTWP